MRSAILDFNRVVSPELMDAVRPGCPFELLVDRVALMPEALDVQLRRSPDSSVSAATLYVGLTAALMLEERSGAFRLVAHDTHKASGGFDPAWSTWQPLASLAGHAHEIDGYLDRILAEGGIDPRWFAREGVVQATLTRRGSTQYGVIQREASVWSSPARAAVDAAQESADRIWNTVATTGRVDRWWPGVRDHGKRPTMGRSVDLLGVDASGRLAVIEVKPAGEIGKIPWAVAQVTVYAELFAEWLDTNPSACAALETMAMQRHEIGLLDERWTTPLDPDARVVPVLAIGSGNLSTEALPRVAEIAAALGELPLSGTWGTRLDPLEVWICGPDGRPGTVWRPGEGAPPTEEPSTDQPFDLDLGTNEKAAAPTFRDSARAAGVAWKTTSVALPEEARAPGPYGSGKALYPFVLPEQHRWHNLLAEAREIARLRFTAAKIHWHGDGDGPNPHACSSQIQCLNALAPFVEAPGALARLFSSVLSIDEVLSFGATSASAYDTTDHVVFEWQGSHDYLGEWGSGPTRGAHATSADAAIRYRTPAGHIEIALIEWKYTESYPHRGRLSGSAKYHESRLERYADLLDGPESPIRADRAFTYEDLFAEPIYQLARTQALAAAMEEARELEASVVRVVYAAPRANTALLRQSLGTMRFEQHARAFGSELTHAWRAALRQPDRFQFLDTATWVAPGAPTSDEFRARYGHLGQLAPPVDEPIGPDADSAAWMAQTVLLRVAGEGGVLEQVLALLHSERHPEPGLLAEFTARAEEVTELARRLRAEEIAALLEAAKDRSDAE